MDESSARMDKSELLILVQTSFCYLLVSWCALTSVAFLSLVLDSEAVRSKTEGKMADGMNGAEQAEAMETA